MQRWAVKYSSWSRWQPLPFFCSTSPLSILLTLFPVSSCVSPDSHFFLLFPRHAGWHWRLLKGGKAPRYNSTTNLQASVSTAGIEAPWGGQLRGSQPLGLDGCHLASLSAPIYLLAKIHELSDCFTVQYPEGMYCFFNSRGELNVSYLLLDCILSVVRSLLSSFCWLGLHLGIVLQKKTLCLVTISWRIFSTSVSSALQVRLWCKETL